MRSNQVKTQQAERIFNIEKIKKAKFRLIIKGGLPLLIIALIAMGIWQQKTVKAWLGWDRFFSERDENFKILVLPLREICTMGGKNYNAGYVLAERLYAIKRRDKVKIEIKYWSDFVPDDYFNEFTAKQLQQYHYADMIIFGAYQTSDCSAEGDQICLNYITDEKWNLGNAGMNVESEYQKGGLDDLRKGKLQEKVENIALFVSILAQIKSIDHARYLQNLQALLNRPDFNTNTKIAIYVELADKLKEEGKLEEPLQYYQNAWQLATEIKDLPSQAILCERMGDTYMALGNPEKALSSYAIMTQGYRELSRTNPKSISHKRGLSYSFAKGGVAKRSQGDFNAALRDFQEGITIARELCNVTPQNLWFFDDLAVWYQTMGDTYRLMEDFPNALLNYEESQKVLEPLYLANPQNIPIKNNLAVTYGEIADVNTVQGKFDIAARFGLEYIRLKKEICQAEPNNVYYKDGLAIAHLRMGELLLAKKDLKGALPYLEQYNTIARDLVKAYPSNGLFQETYALSFSKLGELYMSMRSYKKAIQYLDEGRQMSEDLSRSMPQNSTAHYNLAGVYSRLGMVYEESGGQPEALKWFEQETAVLQMLSDANPSNGQIKKELAFSYRNMASTCEKMNNVDAALRYRNKVQALFQELHTAAPDDPAFKSGLGLSYFELGQLYQNKIGDRLKASKYFDLMRQYSTNESTVKKAAAK